jgi:hypothetical protein
MRISLSFSEEEVKNAECENHCCCGRWPSLGRLTWLQLPPLLTASSSTNGHGCRNRIFSRGYIQSSTLHQRLALIPSVRPRPSPASSLCDLRHHATQAGEYTTLPLERRPIHASILAVRGIQHIGDALLSATWLLHHQQNDDEEKTGEVAGIGPPCQRGASRGQSLPDGTLERASPAPPES